MKKKFFIVSLLLALLLTGKGFAVRYYYGGSNAYNYDQSTVLGGETNRIILRIEIYVYSATGSNISFVLNSLLLSTNGSTSAADIANAKLWRTGTNASFVSPVLLQTINNPSGNMNFTGLNVTNNSNAYFYYWLTYDVSTAATAGNLLDAQVRNNGIVFTDGNGSGAVPAGGFNPDGYRIISCPAITPPATPALSALSMFTKPTLGTWVMSTGVSIIRQPDGRVYTAGSDQDGEFGDGIVGSPFMSNNQWILNTNSNIINIVQVDNGINTNIVLKSDGTVWAWGDNWWGKIGNGTYGLGSGMSPQPTPQQVIKSTAAGGGFLTNVVKVMSGYSQTVALTSDHRVYAWGYNAAQGFGPSYGAWTWHPSAELLTDNGATPINWAIDVDCGDDFITMLRWDSTVWTMGYGSYGQLGNGVGGIGYSSAIPRCALAPGTCNPLSNIISISAGRRFMLALQSTGNVYAWGLNNYGQTGTGNAGTDVYLPKKVLGVACSGFLSNIVQIAAAGDNGYALDADGNLYSWGSDQNEELADGPGWTNQQCPQLVATGIAEVQAGLNAVIVRKTTGEICGAGNNWFGNFGLGGPWGCCDLVNVITCTSLPLPVELISFTGENKNSINHLHWSTASEINNDYFIVERSADGIDFENIGTVDGHGNSNQPLNYFFDDVQPASGINYYRLKQIDYDGKFEYSKIIAVRNNPSGIPCFVFQSELSGNFILKCSQQENAQAQILNVDGRILKVINITGNSENKIDLQNFDRGTYILRIIDEKNILNFKLIKN
ncbi:MAG TPA: T9SS type A sorting domain-containing protein [Bacteroidia bacterium]|nr:T9SS type A sorting domain-containing protein [Bacteroidia bacterium]